VRQLNLDSLTYFGTPRLLIPLGVSKINCQPI
jgi:hypothetical protein